MKIEKITELQLKQMPFFFKYVSLVKTGLLEVEKYKSGSISSASWDGSQISNSEAGRLLGTKFYFVGEELFQKGNAAC